MHIQVQIGRSISDSLLRAMFAARKSVFVDLLKWQVPVIGEQYEVDQFDTDQAQYIVLTDANGDHLGSARLLPTVSSHILDSLYADLCAGDPPRGAKVFEITRFCLDRNLRAPERRIVRNALVTTLVEHALATGIEKYTAIAEFSWFQQILEFGWKCQPLGLPALFQGKMLAAFTIEITPETPALLRKAGIVADHDLISPSIPLAA